MPEFDPILFPLAVTNYARKHGVIYENEGRAVSLSLAYKDRLRAYSKRQFDPFNRRERIVFPMIDSRLTPKPPTAVVVAGEDSSKSKAEIKIVYPKEAMQHSYPVGSTVHKLITTVCQLNFFKFAITTGVLRYARDNKEDIERDMIASLSCKPSDGEAVEDERTGRKRSRSAEGSRGESARRSRLVSGGRAHQSVQVDKTVMKQKVSFTMTFN
jgi:hypothetical protein